MSGDRSVLARLRDSRRYAVESRKIAQNTGSMQWSATEYMTIRYCLMIVGEALNYIPGDVLAHEPGIPWRRIIALRHRLAHGYWLIDQDIIAEIIRTEIEPLVEALDRLIARSQ
jgi:uncharacterized protein with HEPN domain